jgi:hypothetical protein
MELSIPMLVCLGAVAFSSISIILSVKLAMRLSSANRTAAPDEELVAVMSAAVAAATGMPASSVRLVSIQARGSFTTPVWGHAERPARGTFSSIRG